MLTIGFFFCKASRQECQKLIEVLELYEAASGQKINADKSSVFFSHNTPDELKNEVLEILGPMQDQRHRKYLGLPSVIGKSKKEVFAEVRKGGEKIIGVEGKGVVQWWKGNSNQCYGPGHTNMYYELLLAS